MMDELLAAIDQGFWGEIGGVRAFGGPGWLRTKSVPVDSAFFQAVVAGQTAGTLYMSVWTWSTDHEIAHGIYVRRVIPRVDGNGWHYLLRFPDGTVAQCAGDWDIARKHLKLIRSDGTWPDGGPVPTLIGAYGPNAVGGPEGRGGIVSFGYSPNLIGSIDTPRDEWIPA